MKNALYSIVSRCNVADSHREVLCYAISRLKPEFWKAQRLSWRVQFARACRDLHKENRRLYRDVMRGMLYNVWQDRNEFRWANRAGEGTESTFELAVQAAEHALLISAINALPRGAALCEHFAYVFHPDDDPEQPAQLLVDILAWRTNSQRAEDEEFLDQSDLLHAIESLPAVRDIEQVGDIDHENGRGWTYEVTLA